ncbi:MAG: DUF6671 family protein [Synechococcaceae cyanobacterium]
MAWPSASPYAGQRICLTTRHGKERALALPFRRGLGASLEVQACDTDRLGTFSGEVERPADAPTTCRRKAVLGLEASGLKLGLASEASFGPHPEVPLLPVGQELLLFIDLERNLSVLERRLEWRTNYSHKRLGPEEDPSAWLRQVGFPSHAVIARPADGTRQPLCKGLISAAALREALAACRSAAPGGEVWLETDMRAHLNPTRMRSIRRLGLALARRLLTPCPECRAPGWGLLDTEAGLPCSWCGGPTELTAREVWGCQHCGHRRLLPRRDGLEAADPGQCPRCNP